MMRDLASPVAAFIREKCELGINKEIAVGLLFEAYKHWCDENNYPKSPMPVFARDLRAAVASIRLRQAGPTKTGSVSTWASTCGPMWPEGSDDVVYDKQCKKWRAWRA